jgi:hypothetical protein
MNLVDNLVSGISNDTTNRYVHYSGIFKGNKKICTGTNNSRNVFNGKCICFSTHAEVDVVVKLLKVATY